MDSMTTRAEGKVEVTRGRHSFEVEKTPPQQKAELNEFEMDQAFSRAMGLLTALFAVVIIVASLVALFLESPVLTAGVLVGIAVVAGVGTLLYRWNIKQMSYAKYEDRSKFHRWVYRY